LCDRHFRVLRPRVGSKFDERARLASSVHVSLRSYLQWESGQDLPLRDGRILAALGRELHVPTDRIVTAFPHNPGLEPDNDAPSQ